MKLLRSILARVSDPLLAPLAVAFAIGAASLAAPAHANDYGDIQLLMRSGKQAEALAKTEQYIAEKPRDPQLRFLKGVIQTDSGKPADAIATFTALTQDYPELPEPYNNLAALYASQNQFDKARVALEMAVRLNPSYAVAHENLGDVYARMASQSYAKAMQLDASNAQLPPKLNLIREVFAPKGKAPRAAAK
jgi:tetratricopeptide (TPR) repeat protein